MPDSVTLKMTLSDEDRALIVQAVLAGLQQLLAERKTMLVDADEMARLLDLSRTHFDRLKKEGLIPTIGEGRAQRFRPEAVIAALEKHEVKLER